MVEVLLVFDLVLALVLDGALTLLASLALDRALMLNLDASELILDLVLDLMLNRGWIGSSA